MNTLTPLAEGAPAFRWGDVAPEHRDWLKKRTEDVVGLAYRQACDIIRIGAILTDARKALGKGRYKAWVESELPFSLVTAHRYRAVARAFAAFASFQFEMFDPSALYLLAQPRGVKPEVRAHAVLLAESGERVTHSRALELIDAHRPDATTKKEQKSFAKELGERMKPIREQEKTDRKESAKEESEAERAAHLAKVGDALTKLAAECTVVHVARIDDEDDLPLFSVTTYREDDRPHNTARRTLLEALLAAGDRAESRLCPTCDEVKELCEFGELKSGRGGRNRCCKVCERLRIATHKRKKKRARPGA